MVRVKVLVGAKAKVAGVKAVVAPQAAGGGQREGCGVHYELFAGGDCLQNNLQ